MALRALRRRLTPDPRPVADFWCAVLGWQVVEADDSGVSIGPADGRGTSIDVLKVPEAKTVKNRLHLDLRCNDVDGEVARIADLGGRLQATFDDHVLLVDPEGNEFCLQR